MMQLSKEVTNFCKETVLENYGKTQEVFFSLIFTQARKCLSEWNLTSFIIRYLPLIEIYSWILAGRIS